LYVVFNLYGYNIYRKLLTEKIGPPQDIVYGRRKDPDSGGTIIMKAEGYSFYIHNGKDDKGILKMIVDINRGKYLKEEQEEESEL